MNRNIDLADPPSIDHMLVWTKLDTVANSKNTPHTSKTSPGTAPKIRKTLASDLTRQQNMQQWLERELQTCMQDTASLSVDDLHCSTIDLTQEGQKTILCRKEKSKNKKILGLREYSDGSFVDLHD